VRQFAITEKVNPATMLAQQTIAFDDKIGLPDTICLTTGFAGAALLGWYFG